MNKWKAIDGKESFVEIGSKKKWDGEEEKAEREDSKPSHSKMSTMENKQN